MPFRKKGVTNLSALPVKKGPIKYAEHYELQTPYQSGSKYNPVVLK